MQFSGFVKALKFPFQRFGQDAVIINDIPFNPLLKFIDRRKITFPDHMPLQFGKPVFYRVWPRAVLGGKKKPGPVVFPFQKSHPCPHVLQKATFPFDPQFPLAIFLHLPDQGHQGFGHVRVQLVGQKDDPVHFGQPVHYLFDKTGIDGLVPDRSQMVVEQFAVPYIGRCYQGGGAVPLIFVLFALVAPFVSRGGADMPFNGLDARLFIYAQYMQVGVFLKNGAQDKFTDQTDTDNKSPPIIDFGV